MTQKLFEDLKKRWHMCLESNEKGFTPESVVLMKTIWTKLIESQIFMLNSMNTSHHVYVNMSFKTLRRPDWSSAIWENIITKIFDPWQSLLKKSIILVFTFFYLLLKSDYFVAFKLIPGLILEVFLMSP